MKPRTSISPLENPLEALRAGVRQRQTSPETAAAIGHLLRIGVAVLLLVGIAWLGGFWRELLGAVVGVGLMVEIFRLHRPHIELARFWKWALLGTGALMLLPKVTGLGQVLFIVLLVIFLVVRRFRVLKVLSSRQSAVVFISSVALLVVLSLAPELDDVDGWFVEVLHNLHAAARVAAGLLLSLFCVHLFLGIRLHFLRLQPKLAVAGLLLAAVPVLLVAGLATVGMYGVVGGSRGSQALSALDSWLSRVANDELVGPGPFGIGFGDVGLLESESEASPGWMDELVEAVAHSAYDPMPAALWLRTNDEIWAIRIRDDEAGRPVVTGGRRLDQASIQDLSDRLDCQVVVIGDGDNDLRFSEEGFGTDATALGEGDAALRAWPERFPRDEDEDDLAWIDRWIVFGGARFDVYDLDRGALDKSEAVVSLWIRPRDLISVAIDEENDVNQAIGIALIVLAVVFLILEGFALYFGLRIVGGITGAVHKLHKTTQQLARGDLDVSIDLPNEDEFGDLASSFNEMTHAIRIAQEQIAQKQRLELEIETASRIQQRLLPDSVPLLPGYQLAGSSTPSKQVGGDYFDFLPLPDGRMGIAVADVSGKGIPAALLMSNIQASLQSQVLHDAPIADMVGSMNELLSKSTDAHMFATFFYTVLDPKTGCLTAVNAGHDPPLLVRADGSVETIPSGGLILGMLPGQTYREAEVVLQPGDVLVMFTDGITEAMGPGTQIPGIEIHAIPASVDVKPVPDLGDDDDDDEEIVTDFFEEYRLREIIIDRRHESAEGIRRAVLAGVARHVQDVPQSDDLTIVVVKRDVASDDVAA